MKPIHLLWFSLLLCATLPAHAQKPELVVPIGHTSVITSLAFSPNGKYAVAGSWDKTLKLWDIQTGQEVHTFKGHKSKISSVAFSPDGRYALSGSEDHTLKLWEVSSGREVRTFTGHTSYVTSVAFSPDGRYVLSGSWDKTLKLWDVQTGRKVRTFKGHTELVTSVAFSPDGRYALSGSWDHTLKLWDIQTGREVRTFTGHGNWVESIAFSSDGRYVLSGSSDHTLKLWDIQTGLEVRTFEEHKSKIISVAFSPDGYYALLGLRDHTLKLWDIQTGREVRTFEEHKSNISSVAFSPDGHYALGSDDLTLKLWDIQTGQAVRTFQKQSSWVYSVAFSPDGHYVLSGGGTLKLWDFRSGQGVHTYKGHEGDISSVAFSPDSRYALSGSDDHTLKLWDIQTGQVVRTFQGAVRTFKGEDQGDVFSILPGGRYASVSPGGYHAPETFKLLDIQTGDQLHTLESDKGHAMAISPDGHYALSTDSRKGNSLELWDIQTGREVRTFKGHKIGVNSIAFSSDGRYALSGSSDETLKLWDIQTGREVRTFKGHTELVTSVAFSPDGRYALSGSWDHTLKLWDIQTGRNVHTFTGHGGWVKSVGFSPDGRYVLSGSFDNTTKIWNTATGKELATLIAVDSTDWVVTTPAGLFDASPGAMKLMHYVVNDSTDHDEPWKVIDLQQLKQRYYQPGLLPILMGYSKEPLRQVPAFEGVALPPTIQLSVDKNVLTVKMKNRKGGIGKVSVSINGAEVVEDLRPNPQQNSTQTTLTLHLPLARFVSRFDTLNTLRVVALNAEGWISSRPEEIVYRPAAVSKGGNAGSTDGTAMARDTRLRAVIVGTSNVGLRFAHKDAEQIANGLRLAATELLGPANVSVQTLTTADNGPQQTSGSPATKAAIVQALEAGKATRPQDIFVLYLSGHGINYGKPGREQDGDFYYLTAGATSADAAYLNDPAIRQTYALSSEELTRYLNLIPARKKLLILDVCAAGKGADKLLVAARDIPPSQTRALDRLYDRTGFYVLAGSAADAVSYESNVYGQGLLTYALLQGMLSGELRRDGADEFLDVVDWFKYAEKKVPEMAKGVRGIQQPFYRGLDTEKTDNHRSFDVGKVTAGVKAQIHIAQPKPVLLVKSFQDEMQFDDVLNLTSQIEGALIDLSARGTDAPMLFMEAKDYPGAYALVGRYTVNGEAVQVKCRVLRDTAPVGEFVVTGQKSKVAELAKSVLAQAQGLVKR